MKSKSTKKSKPKGKSATATKLAKAAGPRETGLPVGKADRKPWASTFAKGRAKADVKAAVREVKPQVPKADNATSRRTKGKDGRLSGLDAAAKVLAQTGKPMRAMELVAAMEKQGLWKTNGKTPEATIYAAMIREIQGKGKDARFTKVERGLFAAEKGA